MIFRSLLLTESDRLRLLPAVGARASMVAVESVEFFRLDGSVLASASEAELEDGVSLSELLMLLEEADAGTGAFIIGFLSAGAVAFFTSGFVGFSSSELSEELESLEDSELEDDSDLAALSGFFFSVSESESLEDESELLESLDEVSDSGSGTFAGIISAFSCLLVRAETDNALEAALTDMFNSRLLLLGERLLFGGLLVRVRVRAGAGA
jgi:hypothetical protein